MLLFILGFFLIILGFFYCSFNYSYRSNNNFLHLIWFVLYYILWAKTLYELNTEILDFPLSYLLLIKKVKIFYCWSLMVIWVLYTSSNYLRWTSSHVLIFYYVTPGVDFNNVLRAAFLPIIFRQKITKLKHK